jgi:hypothetical protein
MSAGLVFLNRAAASMGRLAGCPLNPAYVAACRWFHCGMIDRTRTLAIGLPYVTLDPLPRGRDGRGFETIADAVGESILRESLTTGRRIQVLWSGGIDSTVALIALTKAAFSSALRSRIEVVCSAHSIREYPAFFADHVTGTFSTLVTTRAIGDTLDHRNLIITGEHGDQLFGSVKLEPLVRNGTAGLPYRKVLPKVLAEEIGSEAVAHALTEYLAPQVARAPVPIRTVFDYIWWVNFSLKWQHVSLRIPVFRRRHCWATYLALRHFFRYDGFQRWALEHRALREIKEWRRYKEPAKRYIYSFTNDAVYYENKTKEPSLKNVLVETGTERPIRFRVHAWLGQPPRFRRAPAKAPAAA